MHGARSGSESMKLGICSMWGPSLQSFREEVKLASDLGYDLVTIGDSPAGWHELYVSMTLAALDAPTATIAPLVTSPRSDAHTSELQSLIRTSYAVFFLIKKNK